MTDLYVLLDSLVFPDVVCLTETWFSNNEIDSIVLNNYILATHYCRSKSLGGGVAIFVKNNLKFHDISFNVDPVEGIFEFVSLKICLEDKVFNIIGLYRPPSGNFVCFINSLEQILSKSRCLETDYFICGDFNVNFDENNISPEASYVMNLFTTYGFSMCVKEFTRVQGNCKSIIDNFFTNVNLSDIVCDTVFCHLSDHYMQRIQFHSKYKVENHCSSFYRRNFKYNYNVNNFIESVKTIDWNACLEKQFNADEMFTVFFNTFMVIITNCFPEVRKKHNLSKQKNINNKWITPEIRSRGQILRDIYRVYKNHNCPIIYDRYITLKRYHKKSIYNAKRNYFNNKILNAENKTAAAWNIIKCETSANVSKRIPKELKNGNEEISTNYIAEKFNKFFLETPKNMVKNHSTPPHLNITPFIGESMKLLPILPEEVGNIIKKISKKDSKGFDDIPCSLLRHVIDYIKYPLAVLINKSFEYGIFPSILKQAIVVPIHKKGPVEQLSNYRGISLLSVFSKIYENAFCDNLKYFIKIHQILSPSQFGFQANISTEDALLQLLKCVMSNLDEKNKTVCINFDFSRAFDTIRHELLTLKLQSYGITDNSLSWIMSFLENRTQKVRVSFLEFKMESQPEIVDLGIPQGSTLGPILFLLFINDLKNDFPDCYISQFADDTSLIISAKNDKDLSDKARDCAEKMSTYCEQNYLSLNLLKTEMVWLSANAVDRSLYVPINGTSIHQNITTKSLGLYIDTQLKWVTHVDYICKNLTKNNYVLLNLRKFVSIDILKTYYYAHIHSRINYCIISWGGSPEIKNILILQKRIIRTMLFKPCLHSCRELFKKLKILTVISMYILSCVLHIKSNPDLYTNFYDRAIKYNLRHTSNLRLPQHNLQLVANSILILPQKIYNHLPQKFKTIKSIPVFKRLVKEMLTEHSFYSLNEYFECKNLI